MFNKKQSRTSWVSLAVLLLAIAGFLLVSERDTLVEVFHQINPEPARAPLPVAVSFQDVVNTSTTDEEQDVPTNSTTDEVENPEPLPVEFLLDVPFTSQAPKANWDAIHEDACEEASAITVDFYYKNKTFTPDVADEEILKFVDFENQHLGFFESTTAEETAQVIRDYLGYARVDVIDNPTVEQIKKLVATGYPLIVPAQGQQLGNPNFTAPGPVYHMFVIRGYTQDQFITNDVGTRKGENYRYDIPVVMNAMHDWNGGDVENGAKRIIVMYPNA